MHGSAHRAVADKWFGRSALEDVANQLRGRSSDIVNEGSWRAVISKSVILEEQFCRRLRYALLPDDHGGRMVLVLRPFLKHVSGHQQRSAVGNVNFIAGRSIRSVFN